MTYIDFLESLPKVPNRFSVEPSDAEKSVEMENFWQDFLKAKKISSAELAGFDGKQRVGLYVDFSFAVMQKAKEEK